MPLIDALESWSSELITLLQYVVNLFHAILRKVIIVMMIAISVKISYNKWTLLIFCPSISLTFLSGIYVRLVQVFKL